ncbi:DUF4921 family protein [Candidatus Sumerlaeota bacterium]|nr:DUF4921 family protein [Candidatus Sumerlaeota bacterium]
MKIGDFFVMYKDGTIKQINPITGDRVWYVPERWSRVQRDTKPSGSPVVKKEVEDYCDFCRANYFSTTPEKVRVLNADHNYQRLYELPAEQYYDSEPLFRRFANLFEIIRMSFWQKNYSCSISPKRNQWKEKYLQTPEGRRHIENLLHWRLERLGLSQAEIEQKIKTEFNTLTDPMFGGWHDLIVVAPHLRKDAEFEDDVFYQGDLSVEDHYQYIKFTAESVEDIMHDNGETSFVVVFQNWLKEAGASRDHLHRQLLAIDEWGPILEKEATQVARNKNFFPELTQAMGQELGLVVAENKYAICLVEIGQRFPTAVVYSKSAASRPFEHSEEELLGISNLIYGCHRALGNKSASNEEWIYQPLDCPVPLPFQVRIKWRAQPTAGFEGATEIFINPINPFEFRDRLVQTFQQLKAQGIITDIAIGEDCPIAWDSLE